MFAIWVIPEAVLKADESTLEQLGVTTQQPWSRIFADFCFQTSIKLLFVVHWHTVDTHAPAAYPEHRCEHNCYLLYNRCTTSSCTSWLSFISIIFQAHLQASWLSNCTITFFMVCMWPTAIALNYSIKHIPHTIDINNIWKITNSTHLCGARSCSPQSCYDNASIIMVCTYSCSVSSANVSISWGTSSNVAGGRLQQGRPLTRFKCQPSTFNTDVQLWNHAVKFAWLTWHISLHCHGP